MSKKNAKQNNDQRPIIKNDIDEDMIIDLLNIYLQEYIHRDNLMWSQTYKFFFASLIIMLLPNLTERLGIIIPEIFSSHK